MFDWDDLKCFLAVAQHGSTIAAGKALGLNQSTVQRRIAGLEQRLGRKLVARTVSGYQLTEFGRQVLPHAQRVQAAVGELELQVADAGRTQVGVIRVTCPEPIVQRMAPLIERFHARHPNLRVEFVMSDKYLDLAKGEADVAFRSGDTDDELIGRKIADSIWAIYASPAYIERHGKPLRVEELSQHALIGFDDAMSRHRVASWLAAVAPDGRIVARNNSVLGMLYAVKSGVGVGALPTAIADGEPELVRVLGPIGELARSWRILTHPDLRRTPRIAAFFDFVLQEREAVKAILSG